jgi:hypothetical protein
VKRAALVLLLWAALLAALTAAMAIFDVHLVSFALLGGASAATLATAALLFAGRRRAPDVDPDAERAVTELSLASGWTGLGVALLALSARLGLWLALVAAAMVALGLGGIVRERRAERRVIGRRRS